MRIIVEPGSIGGSIAAPASKSITQRALAAALLHRGITTIVGAGHSADEQAACRVISQLGALVQQDGDVTTVTGSGQPHGSSTIDVGESGLAARLFLPIAALQATPFTITGQGTLLRRPLGGISEALQTLGKQVAGGPTLPFHMQGAMQLPPELTVDAAGSSQFVSGLLMALSAAASRPVVLRVRNLESRPYIDLTLDVLARFGKTITHRHYREFFIDPAAFRPPATVALTVEGDWSSAACLLVAGAVAGEIQVRGLNPQSGQADRKLMYILGESGASMQEDGDTITVLRSRMRGFDADARDCPDLFPALAALASFCDGESNISGVHRLFHKESNRVESITEMLWRYGVTFSVEDDTLTIRGREQVQWAYIDGYHDHRIVMAATVCALRAKGPVTITHAEAVQKSYPGYFEDLARCGLRYSTL